MLKILESRYRQMKTTCGKVHDYLGVTLDYQKQGKVKIIIVKYTKDVVETFLEPIEGSVNAPATNHLVVVNEDSIKLNEEKGHIFYAMTAKILFLCKQSTPLP
eukprot:7230483-Ditylum_brightwellii.AAC.1